MIPIAVIAPAAMVWIHFLKKRSAPGRSDRRATSVLVGLHRAVADARTAPDQAREHWRVTNLLYRQQLTTSTAVLDARSFLDRAENAYFEARYGYDTASAQLAWAMGAQKPAP